MLAKLEQSYMCALVV